MWVQDSVLAVLAAAFIARATLASLATAIEAAIVAPPFSIGASLSTAKLPLRLSLH
jgi:creatinine amidohydrolase/Fe(II)-dependent formamide hydrolase-like protein